MKWFQQCSFDLITLKICDFHSYIYSRDYDIIAITETWLSNHIYTNKTISHGYNALRKDRDRRGGGVILAFRDTILFKKLLTPSELEILSAEITVNNVNLIVCLIYRSPHCLEL